MMVVSKAEKKAEQDKHFAPSPTKQSIHLTRVGTCSKNDCNYREHLRSSRRMNGDTGSEYPHNQAHHAICVSAMVGYLENSLGYTNAVKDAIRDIYRPCEWCINQEPNMLWMPLRKTYIAAANGNRDHAVWDLDLPCHDWDHACKQGYYDEVLEELRKRIWNRIRDSLEPDGECFEKKDMELAIEALERDLKDCLHARGRRDIPRGGRGTKAAIRNEAKVPMWWLPFSMAKFAVAAKRPVQQFGFTKRRR